MWLGSPLLLNVLLSPDEDISQLGDIILYQMSVERVGELHQLMKSVATISSTVVYQGHLALKVINVVLQTLSSFHLDCEEVVVVPLDFPLRSKLVVEWSITS